MEFLAKSVPSIAHPDRNEDFIIADPKSQLVAIFDGVGGLLYGEIASQAGAESIIQSLRSIPQNIKPQNF